LAKAIWVSVAVTVVALGAAACGGDDGGGASTAAPTTTVPELAGLRPEAADAAVCAAGLDLAPPRVTTGTREGLTPAQIAARLRVVASEPAAGARVARGTPVTVTIASPAAGAVVLGVRSCESASAPAPWTIELRDVALGPSGIGLAMHPTAAPIAVSVASERAREVCPADASGRPARTGLSSFGRGWVGCRPVGPGVVELPPTDGRSHVGIRIRATAGGPATVRRLRVRWGCQDAHFALRDPAGRTPAPVPRCDPAAAP
jgi:hypothetical protein